MFLPYEQFQELWRAAREKTQPAAEPKPPAGAVITDIASEATVEKDVVRVKATLRIELLDRGLALDPAAAGRCRGDRRDAGRQAGANRRRLGRGLPLAAGKEGQGGRDDGAALEYAKAIARLPGLNSVSFEAPQAPVSRWRVAIPQAGVKVNLQPLIAATEVPPATEHDGKNLKARRSRRGSKNRGDGSGRRDRGAGLRRRRAGGPHRLDAEGRGRHRHGGLGQRPGPTAGLDRRRGAPHRATLGYAISRAELRQFSIDVPADQKVSTSSTPTSAAGRSRPRTGRAADHRRIVRAGQGVAASHRGTGEISARSGDRRTERAGGQRGRRGPAAGNVMVAVPESLRAEVARSTGLMQEEPARPASRAIAAPIGPSSTATPRSPSSWT